MRRSLEREAEKRAKEKGIDQNEAAKEIINEKLNHAQVDAKNVSEAISGKPQAAAGREQAVAAAFGRIHAEPGKRLSLLERLHERIRGLIAEHNSRREGRLPPDRLDPTMALDRLEKERMAKAARIDKREANQLKEITNRVINRLDVAPQTHAKLQELENQRQVELAAAEAKWQKAFSQASSQAVNGTFQQRLVAHEKVRGLEKQYREQVRGIQNVYREKGRAILEADAKDKAVAQAENKGDRKLSEEVQRKFDAERSALEREHALKQKLIEQKAALRSALGQQAFEAQESRRRLIESIGEYNAMLKVLPPEVRGRIGGFAELSRIGSNEKAVSEFLSKQIGKISDEVEKILKGEYHAQLEKAIDAAQPKKTKGGVSKGHLGPQTHAVTKRIQVYSKLSPSDLQLHLASVEKSLADVTLDPEEISALLIQKHELETFGAIKDMTSDQLAHAYDQFREIVANGKTEWGALETARLEKNKRIAAELNAGMKRGTSGGIKEATKSRLVQWKNFIRSHFNFSQLLGKIFPETADIKRFQDQAFRADVSHVERVANLNSELNARLQAAMGTKNVTRGAAILNSMNEPTLNGPEGKLSKLEALYHVMSWQQMEARAGMEKMGYTQDVIDSLDAQLKDPVSVAMRDFLRFGFDEIYRLANAVHERMYGVSLAKNEAYIPLHRHGKGKPKTFESPMEGVLYGMSGLSPGSLKMRVKSDAPLKTLNVLEVWQSHLMEMSHWISYAELGREMQGIIGNNDIKLSLKQRLGENGYGDLNKHLENLIKGGVAQATEVSSHRALLGQIQSGVSQLALAFNLHSVGMQIDSATRFAFEIPATRWIPSMLSGNFWSKANLSKVKMTPIVQREIMSGIPPMIQQGMRDAGLLPHQLLTASRWGFAPMQWFNYQATALSNLVIYSDALNQGMTEEQALDRVRLTSEKYTQPSSVAQKSQAEVQAQASASAKMMMMFMTDQRLKTGLYAEAALNIKAGKATAMDFQRLASVHLMALATQIVGNVLAYAWPGDDEKDLKNLLDWKSYAAGQILAPFQGYFFAGALMEGIMYTAFGQHVYSRSTPVNFLVEKTLHSLNEFGKIFTDEKHTTPEKVWKTIDALIPVAGIGGAAVGEPTLAGTMALAKQVRHAYNSVPKEYRPWED